jgi:hypothetical protein
MFLNSLRSFASGESFLGALSGLRSPHGRIRIAVVQMANDYLPAGHGGF